MSTTYDREPDRESPNVRTAVEQLWYRFEMLSDELGKLGEFLGPIRVAGRGQGGPEGKDAVGPVPVAPPHSELYERVQALSLQMSLKTTWVRELLVELEL